MKPCVILRFALTPSVMYVYNNYSVLVAVKEYERVVGREGSDAVSPPRDGAAWTLRKSTF